MFTVLIGLLLIFSVLGWVIFHAQKQDERGRKRKIKLLGFALGSLFLASGLSVLFYYWAFGGFRDSRPVVKDNFYLHETGAVREYQIAPRFKDWLAGANGDYELTVFLEKISPSFPSKIEFSPLVKVTTLLNEVAIDSNKIEKPFSVSTDRNYSKKVLLTKLPKARWKWKSQNYTIRVEVLRGDRSLVPYMDYFITQIGVDGYP